MIDSGWKENGGLNRSSAIRYEIHGSYLFHRMRGYHNFGANSWYQKYTVDKLSAATHSLHTPMHGLSLRTQHKRIEFRLFFQMESYGTFYLRLDVVIKGQVNEVAVQIGQPKVRRIDNNWAGYKHFG